MDIPAVRLLGRGCDFPTLAAERCCVRDVSASSVFSLRLRLPLQFSCDEMVFRCATDLVVASSSHEGDVLDSSRIRCFHLSVFYHRTRPLTICSPPKRKQLRSRLSSLGGVGNLKAPQGKQSEQSFRSHYMMRIQVRELWNEPG